MDRVKSVSIKTIIWDYKIMIPNRREIAKQTPNTGFTVPFVINKTCLVQLDLTVIICEKLVIYLENCGRNSGRKTV